MSALPKEAAERPATEIAASVKVALNSQALARKIERHLSGDDIRAAAIIALPMCEEIIDSENLKTMSRTDIDQATKGAMAEVFATIKSGFAAARRKFERIYTMPGGQAPALTNKHLQS